MPGRILVIDDEPQITRVLRTVLSSLGYQVKTAAEGIKSTVESAARDVESGAREVESQLNAAAADAPPTPPTPSELPELTPPPADPAVEAPRQAALPGFDKI